MESELITFTSSDEKTTVSAVIWHNEATSTPRGIVQITHGMAEYIGRYKEFASALCERGYVVCGHDDIGHGKSIGSKDEWGTLPSVDGERILIEDVHKLRELVTERYGADVPYFLLGHSMGSFVARYYLSYHAQGLAGAIISGTAQQPAFVSKMGRSLAKFIAKRKGDNHYSNLLHSMADGPYSSAIKDARTSFDWLSCDESVVDKYIEDEKCGFPFKAGGYATLIGLTYEIAQPANIERIPKDTPILFISGAQDPVGNNGKGVEQAYQTYVSAGMSDVSIKLYEGMRHEILNEFGKEQVVEDILAWLEERSA